MANNPAQLFPAVDNTTSAASMIAQAIRDIGAVNLATAEEVGEILYPRTPAEIAAGVTPVNVQYPVWHMFRYGIPTDGASDCTAALNMAIAVAAQATSGVRFYFPHIGTVYRFTTKPNTATSPIHLFGDGKETTTFWRDFNGSAVDDALINLGPSASGSTISDLTILSVSGRSGGSLIRGLSDASTPLSLVTLRNLRLSTTGTDTHNYAVYFDGVLKTSAPAGVRTLLIEGCDIFGGSLGAIYMRSADGPRIVNTSTFPAGGTSGRVVIAGDAANKSYYADISGPTFGGIDLSDCENVNIRTAYINGTVVRASTALNCGLFFAPQNEAIFERTGGNQVTARYNESNGRAGLYTSGTAGRSFYGINLTWDSANTFNYDKTGLAAYFGDPTGNDVLEIGCATGTAGNSANVGGASIALRFTTDGNIYPGRASATNMTNGFIYVPSGAGPPSGTPTAISGYAPLYVDTTNSKLYFYSAGSWMDAGP